MVNKNENVPPTSPLTNELISNGNGNINGHCDTINHSLILESSHTIAKKQNPKMSLENLMLPFDQHVTTLPTSSTVVIQTQERRSYGYEYYHHPAPTTRHYTTRVPTPRENAAIFSNYSFGSNVLTRPSVTTYSTDINGHSNNVGNSIVERNHPVTHLSATDRGVSGNRTTSGAIKKYSTSSRVQCNEPKAKRPWMESEDIILRGLVKRLGVGLWAAMAQQIPGRTGKQVRERWLNHLSPSVTKRPWSMEEDNIIIDQHKKIGNCWSRISKLLQGRSDNSVKNRYYTTLRRRISINSNAKMSELSRKRSLEHDPFEASPNGKRGRVWE